MDGQFGRKASLVLVEGTQALDLSDLRFTFRTAQQDVQSPNSCEIRVFNLSEATANAIRGEYSRVIVQGGYESNYGVVFDGTIRQYRRGRVSGTDTYLDILAADGDVAYNWATVNQTLAAGNSPEQRVKAALQAMAPHKVTEGSLMPFTGGVLPRGKVLFGMARAVLANEAQNQIATWSIINGKLNMTPRDGYLPGTAVDINALTGMVGLPEQTENGLLVKCLLNPRIRVGGLIRVDNRSVNQTINRNPNAPPGPAYNSYSGVQLLATITNDGLYRVYVAEHEGDTRGPNWYTHVICLAINTDSQKVKVP